MLMQAFGLLLVGIVARDLLHELFHPAGAGTLSQQLRKATWRAFHRYAAGEGRRLVLAGPVALVTIVIAWTTLLAVGWAFVFLPDMPQAFRYASPLSGAANDGFDDALYVSLVSLSTLGFGDITPLAPALRIGASVEGFLGFVLLTAGISWVLSIRPVLTERRALALFLDALRRAERSADMPFDERAGPELEALLMRLADRLSRIRVHLMQSPETYYFRPAPASLVLAGVLPWLHARARSIEGHADLGARHAARVLGLVLDAFAAELRDGFVDAPADASTAQVFERYAADQLCPGMARVMPPAAAN